MEPHYMLCGTLGFCETSVEEHFSSTVTVEASNVNCVNGFQFSCHHGAFCFGSGCTFCFFFTFFKSFQTFVFRFMV